MYYIHISIQVIISIAEKLELKPFLSTFGVEGVLMVDIGSVGLSHNGSELLGFIVQPSCLTNNKSTLA